MSVKQDCPFCNVLSSQPESPQVIERGRYVTAIFKPYKSSNVNILIVSNEHIVNHKDATVEQSTTIMAETVQMAKRLFPNIDWSMKNNNGANADQTVFHLHTHIYSSQMWPTDAKWDFGRDRLETRGPPPRSEIYVPGRGVRRDVYKSEDQERGDVYRPGGRHARALDIGAISQLGFVESTIPKEAK